VQRWPCDSDSWEEEEDEEGEGEDDHAHKQKPHTHTFALWITYGVGGQVNQNTCDLVTTFEKSIKMPIDFHRPQSQQRNV